MFCKTFSFAALLIAATVAAAAQTTSSSIAVPAIPGLPAEAQAAANSISPARIAAQVRFLSHDLLEGRGPGQRGAELAAEYIATQFALDGLKPAGDNGSYFQKVRLYAVHTEVDKTHFTLLPTGAAPIELAYSSDVVTKDQTGQPTADFDAPIVFVGYGINAPEYKWNDYDGVDVKGKIALIIVNEPPSTDVNFFKGEALTYYGRWTYKYEEAARRGAIGVLLIHRSDLASYGWDVVRNSQAIEKSYLEDAAGPKLRAASWIQHDVAQKLFTALGLGDVDETIARAGKPGFHAVELKAHVKAHIESRIRHYESVNVVGKVPGASSEPGHVVLYTGHYDHFGVDPTRKGDQIFNGAVDNGTGSGILLELAHAFATATIPPPHAVYFAAVTAEEQGLLGSEYLGQHPPVPAAQISLDLNYDALLPIGIPVSLSLGGAERLDNWSQVQALAKLFNFKLLPDPHPGHGAYYRSDHFSLARVGVPAFSLDLGNLFEGHDAAWGDAQFNDYNDNHYHQPSDEFNPAWDFTGDAKVVRFGFVLGWLTSSQPTNVEWLPGDEFEAARKASKQ